MKRRTAPVKPRKPSKKWRRTEAAADIHRLVSVLEASGISWCALGSYAVTHWIQAAPGDKRFEIAVEPERFEEAIRLLAAARFRIQRSAGSIRLEGKSELLIDLWSDASFLRYPAVVIAVDFHGIALRVSSLRDTFFREAMAMTYGIGVERFHESGRNFARMVNGHPDGYDLALEFFRGQYRCGCGCEVESDQDAPPDIRLVAWDD